MLILSRREESGIYIGNDIYIHVLQIKGSQVYLGINAPSCYAVYRDEVYKRIKNEQSIKLKNEQEELLGWQKKD